MAARDLPEIGEGRVRQEGRAKVTGALRYAADVAVARPLHAHLVTSTIVRGRIRNLDLQAAAATPGVVRIASHLDPPRLTPVAPLFGYATSLQPLTGPVIRHEGQIIAVVLAESPEAAREAADRVRVDYDTEAVAATLAAPGVETQAWAKINPAHRDLSVGTPPTAAAVSIDAEYRTPSQHHNAIELYATLVAWTGDELTIHEPSQNVGGLQRGVARQLGVAPEKVRVISPFLGGAFGGKASVTPRTAILAALARDLGRPVKLVATRRQGYALSTFRAETRHKVRLAATRDGKLLAYEHESWELTSRVDHYATAGSKHTAELYAVPHIRTQVHMVRADRSTPGFMRAPAEMPYAFALESAMDELAHALGLDPIELRRRNDAKTSPVDGARFTSRGLMRCFDAGAERFGWRRRNPRPGARREGEWQVGVGCAAAFFPVWIYPASARVRLTRAGAAHVEVAAHDLGTGAFTVFGQTTAALLGVPPECVEVRIGDTRLPPSPVAGGSMQTASVTSAIKLACDKLLAQLGKGDRSARFAALGVDMVEAFAEHRPFGGSGVGGRAVLPDTKEPVLLYAFGAQFAEVRVHARTCEIRVPRILGAFASGRILNARTARAQYTGGMVWGVGSALHEATELDPVSGRYVNADLAEYLVPVNADIQEIDAILIPEIDREVNPMGVKGIGEIGVVGMAAAVANAVFNATGRRVRDLPIRLDALL